MKLLLVYEVLEGDYRSVVEKCNTKEECIKKVEYAMKLYCGNVDDIEIFDISNSCVDFSISIELDENKEKVVRIS